MNIYLNGNVHSTNHQTVLQLLNELGQTQGRFAVEIDGVLVPKSLLADTALQDGMRIEVVQAVGGG